MLNNWHTRIKIKQLIRFLLCLLTTSPYFYLLSTHLSKEKNGQPVLNRGLSFISKWYIQLRSGISGDNSAVLEFSLNMQGIDINGIDMLIWNERGKITEFKVMIRPYKALNMINDQMTAMLAKLKK